MKKFILFSAVLVALTSVSFATTGDGSKKGRSSKKGIKTTKVMKRKTSNRPSKDIYKVRDAKTKEAKKMGVHFAVKSHTAKKGLTAKALKKKTSNRPSKDMYKMRDRKTKEAEKNKKERMRELEAQSSRYECE